jgi:hypothetical protein
MGGTLIQPAVMLSALVGGFIAGMGAFIRLAIPVRRTG